MHGWEQAIGIVIASMLAASTLFVWLKMVLPHRWGGFKKTPQIAGRNPTHVDSSLGRDTAPDATSAEPPLPNQAATEVTPDRLRDA